MGETKFTRKASHNAILVDKSGQHRNIPILSVSISAYECLSVVNL